VARAALLSAVPAWFRSNAELRLFVNAQHHRAIRRVEVKPTDIVTFSSNIGSFRDLESRASMRLETNLKDKIAPTLDGECPRPSAWPSGSSGCRLGGSPATVFNHLEAVSRGQRRPARGGLVRA